MDGRIRPQVCGKVEKLKWPYDLGYELGKFQEMQKDPAWKNKEKELDTLIKKYFEPSVQRLWEEQKRLTPLKMSDVNKHQYVSCVGAQGDLKSLIETLGGGFYKEKKDWNKKMDNPQDYGGKLAIILDCLKDLSNDVIGANYGYSNQNPGACEELLPEEFRKK